ncbi:MAG: hypothetical protein U0X75_16725 [Acidobacteriota bacterium]
MIEIKLINNPQDLQQVFRLRYAVYVEELGAEMEYADHERKEVREPWDETGDHLGAMMFSILIERQPVHAQIGSARGQRVL